MSSRNYRILDIIAGWAMFLVATVVYLLTLEPTGSFWDCGEFIACGYKLTVGHPPGAPFFMILMRLFTLFAPSPEQVGVYANAMSAVASGATILFLYWSIAHLARRWVLGDAVRDLSRWEAILVVGAGVIGSLTYTFTDTFWFSAVEGEVYALSSLFTAVVFWAILKWDAEADRPRCNRWIVLIAYLMGLSIGVHLLNLLVIPAIALVFYFRRYRFTWLGLLKALVLSGLILLTVLYGVIQGLVVIASWFELLFVNGMGLPFMSGAIFFFTLLAVLLVLSVVWTKRRRYYMANLLVVCFGMLLLGYSSYAMIVIRSSAKPTLDQNGANNMFALRSYLNREQYGDRPLIMGAYFNAQPEDYEDAGEVYAPRGDRYEVVSQKTRPVYNAKFTTFFPRMWSSQPLHVRGYKSWVDIKGKPVRLVDRDGKAKVYNVPTFGENLQFLFRYQLGHMYWRYFMWNFAGRQNDFQGYGHDIFRGNWVSGLPFIDTWRLGPQDKLPEPYRSNKAHNTYFMLPLLLGLLGLFFHFSRCPKDAGVVLTLFIMTGIAIVLYLNQKPYEPRERDYTFAGSFYAFAIWIGLGVIPLARRLGAAMREPAGVSVALLASFFCVPVLMGEQNWDDHDRSDRYISVDFGKNMLNSVTENGILFTYADNDTFPLWYAQEVEGFREDVRICNLTYLAGDWYIEEMSRKAYTGDPIPFKLKLEEYQEGVNDMVLVSNRIGRPLLMRDAVSFACSKDSRTKLESPFAGGGKMSFFPSNEFLVPVDTARVLSFISPEFYSRVLDTMVVKPSERMLLKDAFALYAFMGNNDWKRQFYYSPLLPSSKYWGLKPYFVQQGVVSEVLPVRHEKEDMMVDTARLYDNLMHRFSFRSINNPRVYVDETCKRMIDYYLDGFVEGAKAFIQGGMKHRAEELVDCCFEVMPPEQLGWSYRWVDLIISYYQAGARAKGHRALLQYATQCLSALRYVQSVPDYLVPYAQSEYQMAASVMQELIRVAKIEKDDEAVKQIETLIATALG